MSTRQVGYQIGLGWLPSIIETRSGTLPVSGDPYDAYRSEYGGQKSSVEVQLIDTCHLHIGVVTHDGGSISPPLSGILCDGVPR